MKWQRLEQHGIQLIKKILYEHPLCFPCIGEIKIYAIKVKRRGHYYHLSDSMLVKNAFDGINKNWFLSVDALSVGEKSEHPQKMDSGKQAAFLGITEYPPFPLVESDENKKLKLCANQHDSCRSNKEVSKTSNIEVGHNADNNCQISFCGTHTGSDENTVKHCQFSVAAATDRLDSDMGKKYNDLETSIRSKNDSNRKEISEAQGNSSLEATPKTEPIRKRKRKSKKENIDALHDHQLEENNVLVLVNASVKDVLQPVTVVSENLSSDMDKVTSYGGSKNIANKLPRSSSSDVNKQSGAEEVINVQGEVTEVVGEHVANKNVKSEKDISIQGNKSVEAFLSGSPTKKKRKIKRKDDNQDSSNNTPLFSDSTKEISIQYSLGDQQKSSNANIDQLATDTFEVNNMMTTGASTGKRKKKKKLSNSSGKDVGQDNSGVPEVGIRKSDLSGEFAGKLTTVQVGQVELISETCTTSSEKKLLNLVKDAGKKDFEMGSADAGISRSKIDATKFVKASASENHGSTDVETKLEPHRVSASENFISKDENRTLTDQATGIEEKRELCHSKDLEAMANGLIVREINVNENLGSGKSSKKRKKKSRKTQEVTDIPVLSGTEHVAADPPSIVSYKVVNDEQLSVHAEKDATDKVIQNVLESLQQSVEVQENLEKSGEKTRKKTIKKKSSTAVKLRELQSEDESVACKNPISSTGNIKQMDDSSKLSNMAKLAETTTNQLNVTDNSELKTGDGIENDSLQNQQSSRGVGTSKIGSKEREPEGDIVNNEPSKSGSAPINNSIQLSCVKERININDRQSQHETVASSDMLVERAENEIKTRKSKKKLEVCSGGPLLSQSSVKSNVNQGGVKADAANSSTSQQERYLLNIEKDKLKPKSNKNVPKLSESGAKDVSSAKFDNFVVTAEAQRLSTVNASRKSARVASNSSFDSSKEIIPQTKKGGNGQLQLLVKGASRKNNGKVNKSEKEKSLLAKSGSIFKDENSEDEDGAGNSDASTRTPSQISSDYSDGDSDANFNSPGSGSYSSQGEEHDGRRNTKSFSSVSKNMSFDEILRSSRRYKKAKLAASQSQPEDDDDMPVDFVPESEAH